MDGAVVGRVPSMHQAPSSNPSTAKKKNKRRKYKDHSKNTPAK